MTFFNVLWFFLIFVLIGGYFVLDGFDLAQFDLERSMSAAQA